MLKDDDKELFPLLECISSVASALNVAFLPYCQPVFHRCVLLIANTLQQSMLNAQKPNGNEQPDKDFLIVALDLLSELVETLREFIDPLVSQSNLVQMVSLEMHSL
jgi:transportin-1